MSRATKLVPALTYLMAGFAITFTQTLHHSLAFNSWVIAVFGVLYGASTFLVRRPGAMILGPVSILAGVIAPFTRSTGQLAFVLIVWAAAVAVVELSPSVRARLRESLILGVLAGVLAIILAVTRGDLVMVVGFFASYAILAGVYLSIGAFDRAGQTASVTGENGI